jgi:hypothetical protein
MNESLTPFSGSLEVAAALEGGLFCAEAGPRTPA